MSTTINSATTGAERFVRISQFNETSENLLLVTEIPDKGEYCFHMSVNKAELVAAVAKETNSVLIEPKRVELATWKFALLTGISITVDEDTAASSLRQAAAHFLALAAEKEAKEAAQAAEVIRVTQAVHDLYYETLDEMTQAEFVKALIKAGLTMKEDA